MIDLHTNELAEMRNIYITKFRENNECPFGLIIYTGAGAWLSSQWYADIKERDSALQTLIEYEYEVKLEDCTQTAEV